MAPPLEISKSNFESELDQLKKQLEAIVQEEQQLMQRLNDQSIKSPSKLDEATGNFICSKILADKNQEESLIEEMLLNLAD